MFVNHFPVFGGPHAYVVELTDGLERHGVQVTMVLPDEPGDAAGRMRSAGVEVVQVPMRRIRATPSPSAQLRFFASLRADTRRLAEVMERTRAELVVLTGLVNPHAAFAARRLGLPVVWQLVDTRAAAPLRRASMSLVRRLADTVMVIGEATLRLHAPRRPLTMPVIRFFPAVNAERFLPSPERRAETRVELDIPAEVPVVGTVANLNPQKGIEYMIRAAPVIWRAHPDVHLLIVGARYETHRRYSARIAAEVASSPVPAERFIFPGAQAHPERYFPAMDVSLITSVPRSETSTTTAPESMACGVPVVAANVGALAEVVEDGVTGLLVPPRDPDALAAATLRLLDADRERTRMGEAGRRLALDRFSRESLVERHLQAFDAARAHHAARQGRGDA